MTSVVLGYVCSFSRQNYFEQAGTVPLILWKICGTHSANEYGSNQTSRQAIRASGCTCEGTDQDFSGGHQTSLFIHEGTAFIGADGGHAHHDLCCPVKM